MLSRFARLGNKISKGKNSSRAFAVAAPADQITINIDGKDVQVREVYFQGDSFFRAFFLILAGQKGLDNLPGLLPHWVRNLIICYERLCSKKEKIQLLIVLVSSSQDSATTRDSQLLVTAECAWWR